MTWRREKEGKWKNWMTLSNEVGFGITRFYIYIIKMSNLTQLPRSFLSAVGHVFKMAVIRWQGVSRNEKLVLIWQSVLLRNWVSPWFLWLTWCWNSFHKLKQGDWSKQWSIRMQCREEILYCRLIDDIDLWSYVGKFSNTWKVPEYSTTWNTVISKSKVKSWIQGRCRWTHCDGGVPQCCCEVCEVCAVI